VSAIPTRWAGRRRDLRDRTRGLAATDDIDALVALRPDALVHFGPTAAHADDNIRDIGAFLRAGIDVCSTAMTPWVWPAMKTRTRRRGSTRSPRRAQVGGASCFTTGIDPGFANDLFPMTLMGLCGEVRQVRALEILDYINYEGDYEDEMGIGRPPEFTPLLEHTDILVMSWGATVPMMAHAVGIELDEITTTWEKWVTDNPSPRPRALINPGEVAAIRFTINGIYTGEPRICLEHVNRVGNDAAPDWPRGTRTTSTGWRSTDRPRSPRRPPSGSPTGAAATPPPPAVWPPGCGPSTRSPPSTTCRRDGSPPSIYPSFPGWGPSGEEPPVMNPPVTPDGRNPTPGTEEEENP
jgi:hypothetical protein